MPRPLPADAIEVSLPRVVGVASNAPGATFGPRRLVDWEFVWMIAGGARYERDGTAVEVPEGSVVLCRPPCEDAFAWDALRRSQHGFVHFDVASVPASWPAPEAWPAVRALPEQDVWRPMFRHLLAYDRRGPDGLVRQTLAHLTAAFVSGCLEAGPLPQPHVPEPVARALAHLRARLEADAASAVSLGDLADAACVTPAYLCRAFRQSTGRTPAETVRLARLDRALVLLTRSNDAVAAIARACGFASPFHFSRRFAEAFGQPPTVLRQRARAGQTPPLPRLHLWLADTSDQKWA